MSTKRFVIFAATMLVAAASFADQAGPAPSSLLLLQPLPACHRR